MAGNRVRINVFIDEGWLKKLQRLSLKDDRTVGEIIREAVRTLLKSNGLYDTRYKDESGEWVYEDPMGPIKEYSKENEKEKE